tara:strand:- start:426 stop:788 length:363 start_codon:yes stop_codon:yes gene_type:complete
MGNLISIVIFIQVATALIIVGLVLIQQGKGADMGAAFGSGSSGSLFGASGSSNFLSKLTAIAAVVFFSSTLALSFIVSRPISKDSNGGVMDQIPVITQEVDSNLNEEINDQPGKSNEIPK